MRLTTDSSYRMVPRLSYLIPQEENAPTIRNGCAHRDGWNCNNGREGCAKHHRYVRTKGCDERSTRFHIQVHRYSYNHGWYGDPNAARDSECHSVADRAGDRQGNVREGGGSHVCASACEADELYAVRGDPWRIVWSDGQHDHRAREVACLCVRPQLEIRWESGSLVADRGACTGRPRRLVCAGVRRSIQPSVGQRIRAREMVNSV